MSSILTLFFSKDIQSSGSKLLQKQRLTFSVFFTIFHYKPGPAGAQRRRRAKKQMGRFCEESSGMVNRDSVVMVNRETFVVVNRDL